MKRKALKYLALSVVLAVFVASISYRTWLPFFGRYLVTEHTLQNSDAILLLGGGIPARAMDAARLFQKGYAPRIILTQVEERPGEGTARTLGIDLPNEAEASVSVLTQLGVPSAAVILLPERAYSTQSEAKILLNYLERQNLKRAIIVTSRSHSTRAWKIFNLESPPGIDLRMHISRFDTFQAGLWWRHRFDMKQVLAEWLKLINYWRIAWITG